MPPKPRIVELVAQLRSVYAEDRPYYNAAEIRRLYTLIEEHAESFDDHCHVITSLDNVVSGNARKRISLSKAIGMCDSLERIRIIFPHIPASWDEKKVMLREAANLAKDKTELVTLLEEFKVL